MLTHQAQKGLSIVLSNSKDLGVRRGANVLPPTSFLPFLLSAHFSIPSCSSGWFPKVIQMYWHFEGWEVMGDIWEDCVMVSLLSRCFGKKRRQICHLKEKSVCVCGVGGMMMMSKTSMNISGYFNEPDTFLKSGNDMPLSPFVSGTVFHTSSCESFLLRQSVPVEMPVHSHARPSLTFPDWEYSLTAVVITRCREETPHFVKFPFKSPK